MKLQILKHEGVARRLLLTVGPATYSVSHKIAKTMLAALRARLELDGEGEAETFRFYMSKYSYFDLKNYTDQLLLEHHMKHFLNETTLRTK